MMHADFNTILFNYYVFALLVLVPVGMILRRAGFPVAWAALLAAPLLGPVLLATLLAFKPWKVKP